MNYANIVIKKARSLGQFQKHIINFAWPKQWHFDCNVRSLLTDYMTKGGLAAIGDYIQD